MKDAFKRATATGEVIFGMSLEARRELASSALKQLEQIDLTNPAAGERSMQRILQPLFALSGYRLRAQPESLASVRFNFVGESLLGRGDKIFVDFKFTADGKQRSMIPMQIQEYVAKLPPQEPSRIVLVSNAGFARPVTEQWRHLNGPRFELWDFSHVRSQLEALIKDPGERDDVLICILTDMLDRLALGLANASIDIRKIEWRDVERLVAHVLRELGYAVILTEASHDGGRDIIVADVASPELGTFNIEIKHWTEQMAGKREVKRLLEVSLKERRDGALMLATSGVSAAGLQVRTESMTDYLRFGNEQKIALTCRTFARKRQGLWVPPRPFQMYLLEETT